MEDEKYQLYVKCNELATHLSFECILAIEKKILRRTLVNWRILDKPDLAALHAALKAEVDK